MAQAGLNWPQIKGTVLRGITEAPFRPNANRQATPPLGFFMTTEKCHLSCVMCHFNGPNAVKKSGTIDPALVRKVLEGRPAGEHIWFVATGEFFSDPNALLHLQAAAELGLSPRVITHGQLLVPDFIDRVLETGVREILVSVDSIDPRQYAKIRRGGRLDVVLDACAYLRAEKARYPGLSIGVSAVCLSNAMERKDVEEFWRTRVDYLQFVSEYHDIFRFRRIFRVPEKRTDCDIKLIPLPSGRIAPCCAVAVYSHDEDISWLPHLAENTPEQAYQKLCDLYEDEASPLAKLCQKCDWWVQFQTDDRGASPIVDIVRFQPQPEPAASKSNKTVFSGV